MLHRRFRSLPVPGRGAAWLARGAIHSRFFEADQSLGRSVIMMRGPMLRGHATARISWRRPRRIVARAICGARC